MIDNDIPQKYYNQFITIKNKIIIITQMKVFEKIVPKKYPALKKSKKV